MKGKEGKAPDVHNKGKLVKQGDVFTGAFFMVAGDGALAGRRQGRTGSGIGERVYMVEMCVQGKLVKQGDVFTGVWGREV